ncbi:MAG: restriction endonuclease subunit S [Prevotella sp.]|nr:restriction endonuclease subunit S [Prevotella sp.]
MIYKFRDIIEEVEERNTDLRYGLDNIVGVTIEKGLIPTIANLTQTSLDKFYLVKPETFVYNPRTHGVRLGMGFNNTTNIYITSWNNVAFKVSPKAQYIVMPQYLWLFFCRPIWDRLTNFLAWGSSTIVFAWKDFLDIDIDIPSITRQREIVSEYETLTNRIRLNNQMIQHLEATAQALYRKTFVDNIDKENLPEGWRMGTLGEVCEINTENVSSKNNYKRIDYLDSSSVTENKFDAYQHLIVGTDEIPSRAKRKVKTNDIVYSTVRPNLKHYGIIKGDVGDVVVSTAFAVIRSNTPEISNELLYLILTDEAVTEILQGIAEMSKATYPSITPENIMELKVTLPQQMDNDFSELNKSLRTLFDSIAIIYKENSKLTELQSLLLAKMGQ